MQKTHSNDAQRPFVGQQYGPHYACHRSRKLTREAIGHTYRNFMERGGNMTTRNTRRRAGRLTAGVLLRPRELFGESLPELLLLTAVVAAVVSAVLELHGAG
jgi:hypothetical protein